MKRPNLARAPFLDTRPVWVVSAALWFAALGFSGYAMVDFLSVRGEEQKAGAKLAALAKAQQELQEKAATLNRELSAVNWRKLKAEVEAVSQAASKRGLRWGRLLGDLEQVVPWDVRLTSITPTVGADGAIALSLEGLATSREAWLGFLRALLDDPRFAQPVPQREQAPGTGNAVGYRFSLTVTYLAEGRS